MMVDLSGLPERRLVFRPPAGEQERVLASVRDLLGRPEWSEDGQNVYFLRPDPNDHGVNVWSVRATGGKPRLEARISQQPSRSYGFRVHGGKFYLTIGDQQSDIWMAEVEAPR
jgi:hypothetical protein